jgi:hypothetical protein
MTEVAPSRKRGRPLATYLLALALACAPAPTNEPWLLAVPEADVRGTPVRVVGVVEHSELEGGFYLIRTGDCKALDPMNLPAEFQEAGLAIEADVIPRPDQSSIRQAGQIVQVIRIRRAEVPRQADKVY